GVDHRANDSGAAYLFHTENDCHIIQTIECNAPPAQVFYPPVTENDANFGVSVAVKGSSFLIGAPAVNVGGTSAGAAYLYRQTNVFTNETPDTTFQNPSPDTFDAFGFSVAMVGNKVVVGAPLDD